MNPTALLGATDIGEELVFWVCATLAVVGAVGMVVSRKAVHSALFLAATMINLAILYVALEAPFLGMVQIIVYTGAVMMLFVFVMMLVGVDASDSLVETIRGQRLAATIFVLAFAGLLIGAVVNGLQGSTDANIEAANAEYGGNVQGIAHLIFTDYVVAFEVTSALLITAAMGAMLLAHRDRHTPKPSQEELSKRRFVDGSHPGNPSAAGTYARHNAVDTPALLPDGSTSPDSVPDSLQARGSIRPINTSNEREVQLIADSEPVVTDDVAEEDDQR